MLNLCCVSSAIILNSFVVLYLEFCAWFNMKGELGESLTKQKRYFNWYIFIHLIHLPQEKRHQTDIFQEPLLETEQLEENLSSTRVSIYWTRAGGVKSHHKFWQKHTFYICIVSQRSVQSGQGKVIIVHSHR